MKEEEKKKPTDQEIAKNLDEMWKRIWEDKNEKPVRCTAHDYWNPAPCWCPKCYDSAAKDEIDRLCEKDD